MASAAEAMGMTLPGSSSMPAAYPGKLEECDAIGAVMYNLLEKDIKPRDIMTRAAFENAIVSSPSCFLHFLPRPASVLFDLWRRRGPLTSDCIYLILQVLTMILGGSTNAVLHLIAIAHSVGIKLTIDDFQSVSDRIPFLGDLKPSGKYVMEDVHKIGGIPGGSLLLAWLSTLVSRILAARYL